ncbi:hypothetical protein BC833DRAFT_604663 [Globomyces pollinis-pini]|nr:hypothetical protein BC833DRAFT_604663 [Globomyces pollinis-pini]
MAELNDNVKKPMNSFFMYRKDVKMKIIQEHGVSKSHLISKIAAELWAKESDEVKDQYRLKSYNAHCEHRELYPDFNWSKREKAEKTTKTKEKGKVVKSKSLPSPKPSKHPSLKRNSTSSSTQDMNLERRPSSNSSSSLKDHSVSQSILMDFGDSSRWAPQSNTQTIGDHSSLNRRLSDEKYSTSFKDTYQQNLFSAGSGSMNHQISRTKSYPQLAERTGHHHSDSMHMFPSNQELLKGSTFSLALHQPNDPLPVFGHNPLSFIPESGSQLNRQNYANRQPTNNPHRNSYTDTTRMVNSDMSTMNNQLFFQHSNNSNATLSNYNQNSNFVLQAQPNNSTINLMNHNNDSSQSLMTYQNPSTASLSLSETGLDSQHHNHRLSKTDLKLDTNLLPQYMNGNDKRRSISSCAVQPGDFDFSYASGWTPTDDQLLFFP